MPLHLLLQEYYDSRNCPVRTNQKQVRRTPPPLIGLVSRDQATGKANYAAFHAAEVWGTAKFIDPLTRQYKNCYRESDKITLLVPGDLIETGNLIPVGRIGTE